MNRMKKLEKIAGKLEDIVKSEIDKQKASVQQNPLQQPTEQPAAKKFTPKNLGLNLGSGNVMFPPNPVNSDGSVNIVFQFRGGVQSLVEKSGVNAVVVSADAGGIGGGPSRQAFGSANFVNNAISTIIAYLKKEFPDKNVHLGRLGLSSFSGGYDPLHAILQQKNLLIKQPDAVTVLDGMHHSIGGGKEVDPKAMQAWQDLAEQAAGGKTKFTLVHTAVDPGKYTSTTQTADYLLNNLGMQRAQAKPGSKAVSEADKGNFKVYQLYDKQDPYMIDGKANVPGTSGYQHMQALQQLPDVWKETMNW